MRNSTRAMLSIVCFSVAAVANAAPLAVEDLRCEYRQDPLGVDATQPHLSWTLVAEERAQRQIAYRVLVASSPELLTNDTGDLWDSGKVASNATMQILYAGKPLESGAGCWWKVQAWNKDDAPSAWSEPATWTMGLLEPSDWQAEWIGYRETSTNANDVVFDAAEWIWSPGEPEHPRKSAPAGERYFRFTFPVREVRVLVGAKLLITADNQFKIYVNGKLAGESDGTDEAWRSPKLLDVMGKLVAGDNVLAVQASNPTPSPAGLIAKLVLNSNDGPQETFVTDKAWKCSPTAPEGWQQPEFDDSAWPQAMELGSFGCEPWGDIHIVKPQVVPMFRREVQINKPVKRALAFLCGLGFHELSVNGSKVGDHELEPGWTNYRKTCLYATYDVTDLLRQGPNAVGVMLGNGMYNVVGGRYVKFTGTFGPPKVIAQIRIDYDDGTSTFIGTDKTWKSAPSPITFSCIYGGEDYDARLEQPGWNEPGFDDRSWKAAMPTEGPGGRLVAQSAPPIKTMETFQTANVTEPKPGVYVFDLGQNHSGWPQVTTHGPAGKTIKMTPGELLDDQGLVTQRSSGGPTYFSYTLKGEGAETWHPRFTYYGFRYIQVEGATRDPNAKDLPIIDSITSPFLHASAPRAGTFECSNTLFNQIHELIVAAIRSNMQSVFTDCPHREKLGWLEETHLLGPAILYNYDVPTLYAKIIRDMSEAQLDDGLIPDIAPEYVVFNGGFRDSPEWGSAYVIDPWFLYQWYGDRGILESHFDGMKRYVEYLGSKSDGHIVSHGLGDWCDLGPGAPGYSQLTPMPLTATAIYYYDICIVAETARLLGKTDDAAHYASLAQEVRDAFNAKLFDATTGQYATGSQTANAMPLVLGLADSERKQDILSRIVDDVRGRNNQVTAGDVGHRFLLMALGEGGRSDVIFDMINRTDTPGYGYQLAKGATTLVETWDANPAMSQNHFMLGHIEEWFYKHLAGIQQAPDSVGFDKIVIKPEIVGDITWVKAKYDSVRGPIWSEWELKGDKLDLRISIPPNTTADVYVPAEEAASVTEGGKPAMQPEEVTFSRMESGKVVFAIRSGEYRFLSRHDGQ